MKLIQFLILTLVSAFAGFMQALRGETAAANSRGHAGISDLLLLAGNSTLLNDQSKLFTAFDSAARHGTIMAANDANFDAQHLSEPLTEYLVDYPDDEGLEALLEGACPAVPTGRAFSYRVCDDKEAFQLALANEDIREIGGEFPLIRRTGSQVDGRTDNKGLTMVLDNDQGGEDAAVQNRAVANIRNRLLRSELYRLEVLLEANDTNTAANWGPSATVADPDGDLALDIDLGGDSRGIDSNTVLFGGGAWLKRFRAMGPRTGREALAERSFTPAQVATLVGADQCLVSKFRYQSSSTAKTKVVADKVYSYYTKKGAMMDDPSNVKRFYTAVPGGGMFRVYVQPLLKRTLVTVEHYSRVALTSSLGIRKLSVTYT